MAIPDEFNELLERIQIGKAIEEAVYEDFGKLTVVVESALAAISELKPLPFAADEERLRRAMANLTKVLRSGSFFTGEIGYRPPPRQKGFYL